MGKRSNFKRIERDFYPTPPSAVKPLLPFLNGSQAYYEPCAGDGALIRALEDYGITCLAACDIEPLAIGIAQKNALELTEDDVEGCDLIITNPVWDRPILHKMIIHFSNLRPTWLLFDSDWVHTKQAIPYLDRLVMIVSVGRVKWFPESKMTGKDNCQWHLFDGKFNRQKGDTTVFHGRQ